MAGRKERTSCETCAFYIFDDDYGAYLCDMNMDEDDYVRSCQTDIISAHIIGMGMNMRWSESRYKPDPKRRYCGGRT